MTGKKRLLATVGALVVGMMALPESGHAESLPEALISAYTANPRLLAERERLREIDETYIQARAEGRLTSDLSGNYGLSSSSIESSFLPPGTGAVTSNTKPHALQLQVIQPLYQGGRVKALKRQAKSGVLAARENLRQAEQSVLNAAATAYIDVLRDEEAGRIRRENVRTLTRQLTAARDRFDVGEGTRTDIAQAESRLAGAEIGLATAEAQLQASRASYERHVGHLPVDLEPTPIFGLPQTLGQALDVARDNNPQLLAAYFNADSAKAAIGVAKSAGRPVVSVNGALQGSRGGGTGVQSTDTASVTAQFRLPLMTGGLNASRIRAAKSAERRSQLETRDMKRSVDQSMSQLWAQLQASQQNLSASERQVRAAEVAFDGVELEQSLGTRSTLDVLDAESEVLLARLGVVEARRTVSALTIQLLTVMGTFDATSLQLDIEAYDPEDNFNAVKSKGILSIATDIIPNP